MSFFVIGVIIIFIYMFFFDESQSGKNTGVMIDYRTGNRRIVPHFRPVDNLAAVLVMLGAYIFMYVIICAMVGRLL